MKLQEKNRGNASEHWNGLGLLQDPKSTRNKMEKRQMGLYHTKKLLHNTQPTE
jgi:hypothetical protein